MQAFVNKPIKSMQTVQFDWTWIDNHLSPAQMNQSIEPVDMANTAFFVIESARGVTAGTSEYCCRITSPDNVRLYHAFNTSGSGPGRAVLLVVEFYSWVIKSLQEVEQTADPQAIEQVDLSKAIMLPQTFVGGSWTYPRGPVGATFSSSTEIDWQHDSAYVPTYITVLEFS